MESSKAHLQNITQKYTTALDALGNIAHDYFFGGRLGDAQQVMTSALSLTEMREVEPEMRLSLLLLYSNILVVDHLLSRTDGQLMFTTIAAAQKLAEGIGNQQGIADALSLLGQAQYFATMTAHMAAILASLRGGEPLEQSLCDKFNTALTFQQQALERREALHDTRGISESHFFIGLAYERWNQPDTAVEHYLRARGIAEQYGHVLEQAEPSRHLALAAIMQGDWERALPYALDALRFRETAGFMPYLPLDHLLLRDIYLALDDEAKVQHHAEQVMTIAAATGRSEHFADLLKRSLFDPSRARKSDG